MSMMVMEFLGSRGGEVGRNGEVVLVVLMFVVFVSLRHRHRCITFCLVSLW